MIVGAAIRVLSVLPFRRGQLPAEAPQDVPIPTPAEPIPPVVIAVPPDPTPEPPAVPVTIQVKPKGGKKATGSATWGEGAIYVNEPLRGDFRINYTVVDSIYAMAAFVIRHPGLTASYTGESYGLGHTIGEQYQPLDNGAFGAVLGSFADGDEFSIARIGNEIVRYRNDVEIGTRVPAPNGTLYFKAAFFSVGADIDNIEKASRGGYGKDYGLSYGIAA